MLNFFNKLIFSSFLSLNLFSPVWGSSNLDFSYKEQSYLNSQLGSQQITKHLPEARDRLELYEKAPEIEAASYSLYTKDIHSYLAEKNAKQELSIASITKLMTALVFLDTQPQWDESYTIQPEDVISGGKINLFYGDIVSLKDLFYASLVASDNGASLALARASKLSDEEFALKMNEKALELRMYDSFFTEPTGLDDANLSTARDLLLLGKEAFSREEIIKASTMFNYSFKTQQGKLINLESTDKFIEKELAKNPELEYLGGKTGFTDQAGYSYLARFRSESGRDLIVVVLDSGGISERFIQAMSLVDWAFNLTRW